jgi:hypothetical protein
MLPVLLIYLFVKLQETYFEHDHQCSLITCVTGAQVSGSKRVVSSKQVAAETVLMSK